MSALGVVHISTHQSTALLLVCAYVSSIVSVLWGYLHQHPPLYSTAADVHIQKSNTGLLRRRQTGNYINYMIIYAHTSSSLVLTAILAEAHCLSRSDTAAI